MLGRSGPSRTAIFRPENLVQNALHAIANLCFTIFVIGVLVFTIIAATSEPWDPFFHPSTKITIFLTSTSNATFQSDNTVVRTGEDFAAANQTAFSTFINVTDNPEVIHLMMKVPIDRCKDIHFYRFGKPTPGPKENTCDMAWQFRPKEEKTSAFYKDYRRFVVKRLKNCKLSVVRIGDYHSGVNARKKHKNQKSGFKKHLAGRSKVVCLFLFGKAVNDSLPVVESENTFSGAKYLIYVGGGDRCKNMDHYLWSFLCALGEAQYLNRTLVVDLTICLSSVYTLSNHDEEGKDFRFYFDFEHLKETTSVLDQRQFWEDWNKWQRQDGLSLYLVEDFRVTPMRLSEVRDSLIVRRFGPVEPDNYWYRVCEGETESVRRFRRPWLLEWKWRRLMEIVSAISSRLNWDYDCSYRERIRSKMGGDLWNENSEWYSETKELNSGIPVEFDGYTRASIDTEVFVRGKKQIETFNDLTNDCKNGVNTCNTAAN
ncbi:ribonuclease E/G-like protein [Hibiscus syriacus]|uniref:Ribonuclease E/G-like protein n=1 Tax=Hibiscus syriacus TaxID=106335 RepID=A0A6A2YZE3_HIBSY|nr:ribonuclease E/G-like protein [Hibiscus syriacus]